jgi:cytochrome c556
VLDVDAEELKKYAAERYATVVMDLKLFPAVAQGIQTPAIDAVWRDYIAEVKQA